MEAEALAVSESRASSVFRTNDKISLDIAVIDEVHPEKEIVQQSQRFGMSILVDQSRDSGTAENSQRQFE